MSEAGYVELPVLSWLSGHGSHTPGDQGLGWTYRDEAAMAAFNRDLTDPLVETLLIEALLRINDDVHTEAQAHNLPSTRRAQGATCSFTLLRWE